MCSGRENYLAVQINITVKITVTVSWLDSNFIFY